MKTICKRWIAKPVVILILSSLPCIGSLAKAATPCDIGTALPTYQIGNIVELNVMRLTLGLGTHDVSSINGPPPVILTVPALSNFANI